MGVAVNCASRALKKSGWPTLISFSSGCSAALQYASPEKFEHLRDMLGGGLAKLLRFVVFLQVVFALRQPEAALKRPSDHSRAVLGILIRTEAQERAHASALQPLRLR